MPWHFVTDGVLPTCPQLVYVATAMMSMQHALNCKVGGLPIHCHNDIRDLIASLISEVCVNTNIEPSLQPLSGECLERKSANTRDDGRLGIRCRGFRQTGQDAYFDIRAFNPLAWHH